MRLYFINRKYAVKINHVARLCDIMFYQINRQTYTKLLFIKYGDCLIARQTMPLLLRFQHKGNDD
jgi:hypothetical protein